MKLFFYDLLLKEKGGIMKKSLLLISLAFLFCAQTFAADYDAAKQVPSIGKALLEKNAITTPIKFEVTEKTTADNSNFATDKVLVISKNDLKYALNDNETASVIAQALGHIIAGHASRGKLISSVVGTPSVGNEIANNAAQNYASTKENKEADVVAVNLMANGGYNPLAAIVVLTRQTQTSWDAIMAKPANADRAMNIYDYTGYAYPKKLSAGYPCNEYKNFLTYANTVVAQRKGNKKAQAKLDKELKKYRKNSVNQIKNFKLRGGISGWDAAYGLLNSTK